jgi:hypothetical protein
LLVVILVFITWGAQVRPNLTTHTDTPEEYQSAIQNTFVKVVDLQVEPHTLYRNLDFNFIYTSFIFEVVEDIDFIGTYYQSEWGNRYAMDSIPVTDQPSHVIRSPFIIPDKAQSRFTFNSGEINGKLRLYLLYAPPMELDFKRRLHKTEAYCEKPEVVRGSVWRDGLPDSKGVREVHEVNHCILHHSAGSNTKTDYVNVVRNIFLLHTQTNGWDDIGYNFVVAQDGTIFEGREHQNKDSTDNIKGAHFCGKNTNTMGICLLGNYMTTSPTPEAVKSIEHLFTWKCYKDGIKPLGSTNHPTSTSPLLPNIAGHQDGCATACPGDSLYRLLPDITWRVDSILKKCLPSQHSEIRLLNEDMIWYVDPGTGALQINLPKNHTWSHGRIINAQGQTVTTLQMANNERVKSVFGLTSGLYVVEFFTSEQELLRCKVMYTE